MPEFRRPYHRLIAPILRALNARFLEKSECFFGGGTQLAMALGEYRESRDIDFLCASRAGFRMLRETVTETSLGAILRKPLHLARAVRADRDGIRTFFAVADQRIKFEILAEARIDLEGALDENLGVPALDLRYAIAEKLLANADRGLDESTLARDLIDLAFAAAKSGRPDLEAGIEIAERAYGAVVRRQLARSLSEFQRHRAQANAHIKSLAIRDTATLRKGLRRLRAATG